MYRPGKILGCARFDGEGIQVVSGMLASDGMRICHDRPGGAVAGAAETVAAAVLAAAVALAAAAALLPLAGCASPGPPLPPSLKLPEAVSGLVASRVGDEVRLRWTTPSRTTDRLLIVGPVVAEICRETPGAAGSASATPAAGAGQLGQVGQAPPTPQRGGLESGKTVVAPPCAPVLLRLQVTPGASGAADRLPASLTAGPRRLLAYRVQLRNAAGRTAGPSGAVYAVSGPSPGLVEDLRGRATKTGVVLEWRAEAAGLGASREMNGAEAVELDRTTAGTVAVEAAAAVGATAAVATAGATAAGPAPVHKGGLPGSAKEPAESRFRVGAAAASSAEAGPNGAAAHAEAGDAGGTIDRTAQMGHTYRYTAQRVRTVVLGGQTLEVRSSPSAEITVAVGDVFPPEAPTGLVAVPGFAGEAAAGQAASQAGVQAQRPTIDLSWEPGMEPRIAGYRVYRRDLDGNARDEWRRLGSELAPAPAYRDLTVVAGRRYAYRVTAVDEAGNESGHSDEAVETAPGE